MGGEFQFLPENERFGRVALEAVLPYARSVIRPNDFRKERLTPEVFAG